MFDSNVISRCENNGQIYLHLLFFRYNPSRIYDELFSLSLSFDKFVPEEFKNFIRSCNFFPDFLNRFLVEDHKIVVSLKKEKGKWHLIAVKLHDKFKKL